jgi:hypothetical protein
MAYKNCLYENFQNLYGKDGQGDSNLTTGISAPVNRQV